MIQVDEGRHDEIGDEDGMEDEDHPGDPGWRPVRFDAPALPFQCREIMDVFQHLQVKEAEKAKSREKLDQEITDRETRSADPAAAAQPQIADEGNIVVPAN